MYKTIVLGLLERFPELHGELCRNQTLLPAVNLYSTRLKESHEAWKERLSTARPGSDESQIASEALELALKELEDNLTSGVQPTGGQPPSLDGAMAFIRARMARK
jgi:hypothetical protein